MEQSRRAVESYWRSRMIDTATSDEDKVTPVYKLEEICDLLRSSHVSIVKEVSEFILKRLEHKSPIVKQKALRVIKYAVGKSGAQFKREMQRNSVAVRQLIHYKGQPDPLKADALNKAVRETAQEALSVLFSSDDNTAAPTESSLRSRIQGFGSTNYEMPSEDKRSFISEVVDIGSATIKQGLSSFTQSPSLRKSNETGSYKSPNLQRSLTRESDYSDRYEGNESHVGNYNSSRFSDNAGSRNWDQDISTSQSETGNGDSSSTYGQKTREEKLLETIVTSGGVRLQPTRDALHVFLMEASKLDALSLAHAIEFKLKSPMWQVRMKAICVLEAVLRKKDDGQFSAIASYFGNNNDVVVQCSESPQASLREKATKVLSLLFGEQNGKGLDHVKKSTTPQPSVMPDLINTGDSDDLLGMEDSEKVASEPQITSAPTSAAPLIDDLLGDNFSGGETTNQQKLEDDPFADVSFHTSQDKDHVADIFVNRNDFDPFDLLNSSSEVFKEHENPSKYASNLLDGLSLNENDSSAKNNVRNDESGSKNVGSASNIFAGNGSSNDVLNSGFPSQAAGMNASPGFPSQAVGMNANAGFTSQAAGMNANPLFPLGAVNFPSGFMFNPAFASQAMNYSAIAQQQFLAAMSNFNQLGNLQSETSGDTVGPIGGNSPFPDIFNPGIATQPPTSTMNGSKREDTKAFDFISDHLASARDTKRMM